MEPDYTKHTPAQLIAIIDMLKAENERLREERNVHADELKKHVQRFVELRENFARLKSEVELLVKRSENK